MIAIACGDSPREIPPLSALPSHLELTITSQLSAKLGRAARVSCTPPRGCVADLGDAKLPIAIAKTPSGEWTWNVRGMLVRSEPIEEYLRQALDDLGAKQGVSCGPALRSLEAGARIACPLERGGAAFATIAPDGSFATEIVLDPTSAAARTQEAPASSLIDREHAAGSGADDDD